MTRPICSELGGRVIARLNELGSPVRFAPGQLAKMIQEIDIDRLALLAYYAISAAPEQFIKEVKELIDANV